MKRIGGSVYPYDLEGIRLYERKKTKEDESGPGGKRRPCRECSPPSKKVLLEDPRVKRDFKWENPSEYAVDVYVWKKSLEGKYNPGDVLSTQNDITPDMRATVLGWLVAVNRQFDFTLETWCLAVNILDRFLIKQPIKRDCLQLAGLTAFFLAAKHEEVDPPEISELVTLCARSFEPKHFRYMEYFLLFHLKFCFLAPTPSYFLLHLVEVEKLSSTWPGWLTRHIVEKILCDYPLSRRPPSEIAHALFDVVAPVAASVSEAGHSTTDPRVHITPDDPSLEAQRELVEEYFRLTVDVLLKKRETEESFQK